MYLTVAKLRTVDKGRKEVAHKHRVVCCFVMFCVIKFSSTTSMRPFRNGHMLIELIINDQKNDYHTSHALSEARVLGPSAAWRQ